MGNKCDYVGEFNAEITTGHVRFECPNTTIGNSTRCMFHDSEYWSRYPDVLKSEFAKRIQVAVNQKQPFYAIGYNLPATKIEGEFYAPVYLTSALFHSKADFSNTKFHHIFDLSEAVFDGMANLCGTIFGEMAGFSGTTFFQSALFNWAKFHKYASFTWAKIHRNSSFRETEFADQSSFNGARFYKEAEFHKTIFRKHADFAWSQFDNVAWFAEAKFSSASFFRSRIQQANFAGATLVVPYDKEQKILAKEDGSIGFVSFQLTNFVELSRTIFDKVNLGRVSFHRTENLDQLRFLNVDWMRVLENQELVVAKRPHIIEERALTEHIGDDPVTKLDVTREDVLSIYRQLRDNYEKAARYDEAGKFFVSEMEVQRIFNKKGTKHAWVIRNIASLLALYRIFALYGESYTRPFAWFMLLAIGFSFIRILIPHCTQVPCKDTDFIIDSLAAFFQVPRGDHYIDIIERILGAPILGALFIAIKRKFERKIRR